VTLADGALSFVRPGTEWKTVTLKLSSPSAFRVDENFYVDLKDVTAVGR
jgi:hypothetical protein